MATNKHALIRYRALDKCFRNTGRGYRIIDLLEECENAVKSFDPDLESIKRRQLFDDMRFMKSEAGYLADIIKVKEGNNYYYRYSDPSFTINKEGLNDQETQQIRETLFVLSRFKGLPQFSWIEETMAKVESKLGLKKGAEKIIGFDENPEYIGTKYISPIFDFILNKKVLKIEYRSFKQDKSENIIFHPYFLKQYNNRWFCIGWHSHRKVLSTLALDRIREIEIIKAKYIRNKDLDFAEYFDEIVGVTIQGEVQKITLKVDIDLWPYIESKPLHGSQKPKLKQEDCIIITIDVRPNYELESLLLSHGNKIEVISPKSFKQRLMDRIKSN